MEDEDDGDQHERHQISENPHQVILVWTHEEERGAHGAEELGSIGGDRMDSSTPGQREEPRPADHVQVGGDVHCSGLPGELSGHGAVVQVEFDDVVVLELL